MPGMTTAEHQRAKLETRSVRNAMARRRLRAHRHAKEWCATCQATVTPWRTVTGALRYTVRVRGFAAATAPTLEMAVEELQAAVDDFKRAGARKGPTGAKLEGHGGE